MLVLQARKKSFIYQNKRKHIQIEISIAKEGVSKQTKDTRGKNEKILKYKQKRENWG